MCVHIAGVPFLENFQMAKKYVLLVNSMFTPLRMSVISWAKSSFPTSVG